MELYTERGCCDVSMDDVAKNIRMSKRTLYETFNNKTELLNACCQNIQQRIEDNISSLNSKVQEPLMLALYLVKTRAIHVIRYSKLFDDLVNHYPDLFHQYFNFLDGYKLDQARLSVEKMLRKAQKEGDIICYINTEEITHMLFMLGSIAMIIYPKSAKMQDICISMLSFIIMRGCLTEQAMKRYDDIETALSKSPMAYLSPDSLEETQTSFINKYLEVFNSTAGPDSIAAHKRLNNLAKMMTEGKHSSARTVNRKPGKTAAQNAKTAKSTHKKETCNARKTTKQKYDARMAMQANRNGKDEKQPGTATKSNAKQSETIHNTP